MEPKTNEEPFIDLTDYGQYQVRINVSSKERGLEVIKALAEKDREKEEAVAEGRERIAKILLEDDNKVVQAVGRALTPTPN